MKDAQTLRHALAYYTGSDQFYRHPLAKRFTYTEGVKAFAENAGNGAYWLLDILATEPAIREAVLRDGFATVALVAKNGKASLVAAKDRDGDAFVGVTFERFINFTDCPDGDWRFFITTNPLLGEGAITAMLPSEY